MQNIRIFTLPILFIALVYAPWQIMLGIIMLGIFIFPWFLEGFIIYTLHTVITNGTLGLFPWILIITCFFNNVFSWTLLLKLIIKVIVEYNCLILQQFL